MAGLKSKASATPSAKMTREEIRIRQEKIAALRTPEAKEPETHLTQELHENVNRLNLNENEARTVDDAIQVLRYGLVHL